MNDMCICVDCMWVNDCKAYHQVESLHEQPHLTETPSLDPVKPEINVNLEGPFVEYDMVGCGSFSEEKGKWARLNPGLTIPT